MQGKNSPVKLEPSKYKGTGYGYGPSLRLSYIIGFSPEPMYTLCATRQHQGANRPLGLMARCGLSNMVEFIHESLNDETILPTERVRYQLASKHQGKACETVRDVQSLLGCLEDLEEEIEECLSFFLHKNSLSDEEATDYA